MKEDAVFDLSDLRTPRLTLRRLRAEDAASIIAYRGLPEVARFQSWETFGPTDAARLIESQSSIAPDTPGTWIQLVLIESSSGRIIGDCGIHFRKDDPKQVELGITLSPTHQHLGFGSEAIEAVLEYVFGQLHKHRAMAITDADNVAAASLFTRLGFRLEAHHIEHVWFKGAWGSEFVFALLRREWEDNR
mgnify:CR=1 FL=1